MPAPDDTTDTQSLVVFRGFLAAALLFYGFAKLNHAQFTILDSQLDLPLKQVPGFWLTWYYFGVSPFYGTAVALAQIVPALLLLFRRTALLGALLLAPVLVNVVLIDLSFGIALDATILAILLLGSDLALLWLYRRPLLATLLPHAAARPASLGKNTVRLALVVITCVFTWLIANFNNRQPTPLDGAWKVVRVSPPELAPRLRFVYFEYNRAGMCILRSDSAPDALHGFTVDPAHHQLHIKTTWRGPGEPVFDGTYQLNDPTLSLEGQFENHPLHLDLVREPMPLKDHEQISSDQKIFCCACAKLFLDMLIEHHSPPVN